MMKTRVTCASQEVLISNHLPTVLIGERINPSGKKRLAASLKEGDLSIVRNEARAQVEAGADILDVNVSGPGVDEKRLLPRAVEEVMRTVDVPLCLDFNDLEALKGALQVYDGKPIINSVTGEEKSLQVVLPLVKEYGAAVVGLTIDKNGIPKTAKKRVAIAHNIIDRAESLGIPREDVIIDSLVLTVGADSNAGFVTLEAAHKIKDELGVNQTLGASNISYGLPNREMINYAFLAMAIAAGVTCPTLDVAKTRSMVMAIDLILGRDRFARRYLKDFRQWVKDN